MDEVSDLSPNVLKKHTFGHTDVKYWEEFFWLGFLAANPLFFNPIAFTPDDLLQAGSEPVDVIVSGLVTHSHR